MNVLVTSWRHSLTATVLAAFLAPATVSAEEGDRDRPKEAPAPAVQQQPGPSDREAKIHEFLAKRRALEEKGIELRRKMQALKPGQDADAKELQAQAKALQEQMKALQEQARPLGMQPGEPGAGREAIQHPTSKSSRTPIGEPKRPARKTKPNALKREAEQIMQNMQRGGRGGYAGHGGREGRTAPRIARRHGSSGTPPASRGRESSGCRLHS